MKKEEAIYYIIHVLWSISFQVLPEQHFPALLFSSCRVQQFIQLFRCLAGGTESVSISTLSAIAIPCRILVIMVLPGEKNPMTPPINSALGPRIFTTPATFHCTLSCPATCPKPSEPHHTHTAVIPRRQHKYCINRRPSVPLAVSVSISVLAIASSGLALRYM